MNSKLNEFRKIERQLAEMLNAQDNTKEKSFQTKLECLIMEYGLCHEAVIEILEVGSELRGKSNERTNPE